MLGGAALGGHPKEKILCLPVEEYAGLLQFVECHGLQGFFHFVPMLKTRPLQCGDLRQLKPVMEGAHERDPQAEDRLGRTACLQVGGIPSVAHLEEEHEKFYSP